MKLFSIWMVACLLLIFNVTTAEWSRPEDSGSSTIYPIGDSPADNHPHTDWEDMEGWATATSHTDWQEWSTTYAPTLTQPTITVTETITTTCSLSFTSFPAITRNGTHETTFPAMNTTHQHHTKTPQNSYQNVKREDLNIKPKGSALNWKGLLIVVSISAILLWLGTIFYFYRKIVQLKAGFEAEKAAAAPPPPVPMMRPYYM